MKCHNCGEILEKGMKKCPNCGTERFVEDEFEMPILKKEEDIVELDDTDVNLGDNDFEIEIKEKEEDNTFDKFDGIDIEDEEVNNQELELSLEKTRSISPIDDNFELNNLSLIDDINKQIEIVNEEANEIPNENKRIEEDSAYLEEQSIKEDMDNNSSLIESTDLSSDESIKKRKKIFVITGIIALILFVIFGIVLYFGSKIEKEPIEDNYIEKLTEALQKYYDTRDIDDVIYVLEDVKKDPEKVKKVQAKTRTTCDSWLLLYFDEKVNTSQEFDEISEKYKELINGLHNYALIKYDDKRIKALNDTDYDELLKQVNDIYSDSTMFYEALNLYDKKDYNKAYYSFDRIEKDNKYYEKSISYKNRIIDNILEIMQKDITKIENSIDNLEDNEKLQKYTQIESIIFEYNNVYATCNLSDNDKYQNILSTYTSKVSEYSDKVLNGNPVIPNDDNNNQNNNEVTTSDENETTSDNNIVTE